MGRASSRRKPKKPGYDIAVTEIQPRGTTTAGADEPIEKLLASSDVAKGLSTAQAMHSVATLREGGPNRVGPNLWGVVGRPKAIGEGLRLFGRHEGQGRQLDDRRPQRVSKSKAFVRHQDDLRRLAVVATRRRHRLSQPLPTSGTAAEIGRRTPPGSCSRAGSCAAPRPKH